MSFEAPRSDRAGAGGPAPDRARAAQPVALPRSLIAWGALSVALNIGLARFGYGVVLPSLRDEFGLGYTASGVLNALHLVGYLVATLVGPWLARRLGMLCLVVGAQMLVAAGALGCALAPIEAGWGLALMGAGRLTTGLGAGAAMLAVMVLVLGAVAEAVRSAVSVVLWSGMVLAVIGCGLAVPWLLEPGWWRAQFGIAAALALLLVLTTPRGVATPGGTGGAPFTLAAVATPRWAWLVLAYFCFGIGYITYATFAGARLAATAAPVAVMATTWTILGLAMLAGSLLTLRVLADPRLRSFALPGALGIAAIGALIAGLESPEAALAAAALVGLGMVATPALMTAAARGRSSAADYASAFSIATAALGLGQLAGPVLAGLLADRFGTVAAPLFAAAAYALATAAAATDRRAVHTP